MSAGEGKSLDASGALSAGTERRGVSATRSAIGGKAGAAAPASDGATSRSRGGGQALRFLFTRPYLQMACREKGPSLEVLLWAFEVPGEVVIFAASPSTEVDRAFSGPRSPRR